VDPEQRRRQTELDAAGLECDTWLKREKEVYESGEYTTSLLEMLIKLRNEAYDRWELLWWAYMRDYFFEVYERERKSNGGRTPLDTRDHQPSPRRRGRHR
jgi:hypothetical protein